MEIVNFNDPLVFAAKAEQTLSEGEDVFSLFNGVLQAIKAGMVEEPFMATAELEGHVIALFQMTPPFPLNMIFTDEQHMDSAIDGLTNYLLSNNIPLPSIISLKPWAERFADSWTAKTQQPSKIIMDQGLYRLDKVDETLEKSPGTRRLAKESDKPLLEKWHLGFIEDTKMPEVTPEQSTEWVARTIERQEIVLWEDNGIPVACAKHARPTQNSITVSFVYTPSEHRRKGYARTLVADFSAELLKQYQFCILYTDMLNPTSNKIYQEIGYRKIADSVQLGFEVRD
ncbi:GNAT family N-acetyltransferase [Sporosarcina sp. BI001-red]|uniref:GNAT family N-acetyltransferase n=1 Tax=Sporosarcina sp. BI001-red TaxID=2282866 RepID=UPI000E26307F|nr:GNAT family N-acetyltransferase [Sporosarcina sp. BI001-red]REB08097.1 GNAT family N-acetyltransferase [Sporosarcina sp. BI001-red]